MSRRRCKLTQRLHARQAECYFITVGKLLSLLMMLALVFTNGAAVATAMCEHVDAQAHAYALQSTDAGIAATALNEEAAAAATAKKANLADAAAVQLAGYLLPSDPALPSPRSLDPAKAAEAEPGKLASLSISPLLEPPLA